MKMTVVCSVVGFKSDRARFRHRDESCDYFLDCGILRIGANLKAYMPTSPEDILPAFDDLTKFIRMGNHTDSFPANAEKPNRTGALRPGRKTEWR
jgi:hypothetical protein